MLNVYKSNRMENLMDALVSVVHEPLDDPILPEWIGVQSRGMKQWISTTLADRFSVSANIRFLFLKDIIEKILEKNPLPAQAGKMFSEPVLLFALLDFFSTLPPERVYQKISHYMDPDDKGVKRFQICDRIARLFDDYQIYRPQLMQRWQYSEFTGENQKDDDPDMAWQAHLFKKLCSRGVEGHLAHRIDEFFNRPSRNRELFFNRLSLFGISSMPPVFMSVFDELARHGDIHLFVLTPSKEFFGYIRSEKELSHVNKDGEEQYHETGNPLLASLGKTGREFHMLLESFDYHEPRPELFENNQTNSGSVLSVIQSDILNLLHRKTGSDHAPVRITTPDPSIRVHACHTPMREAQVLKDQLLSLFENDPDLCPHDIIVMMPDIEAYSPYIDAVFSMEPVIPFVISDRILKTEFELVEAVLKICELFPGRFERHQVLDLLLCDDIAGQFNILPDEVPLLEKISKDAGILWGWDAAQREASHMPADHENTWAFGLQRLMLGFAMPEDSEDLVNGMLACPSLEGLEADLLGRFAFFCDTLFSQLSALTGTATITQWCDRIAVFVSLMIRRHAGNESQYLFVIQALETIRNNAVKAACQTDIYFDVMKLILEKELSKSSSTASFMVGKMTFCNTLPMRSIPFKVVALMGMNDADFPRKGIRDSFDLIRNAPEPGDKIEREEDRYLFLEALVSARNCFWITYTGRNIKDNSPVPVASVVTELLEVITESIVFDPPENIVWDHPLHPFSERYFLSSGSNKWMSYSRPHFQMAQRLASVSNPSRPFLTLPSVEILPCDGPLSDPESIDIQEVIRFFEAPLPYFMKHHLDIMLGRMDDPVEDREPDSLDGLSRYELGTILLDRFIRTGRAGDMSPDAEFEYIRAMGRLPHGQKGVLEYHDVKALTDQIAANARPMIEKPQLQPVQVNVSFNHCHITGTIPHLTKDEAFWVTYGRLTPKRSLKYWIYHLLLNLSDDEHLPAQSMVIGQDDNRIARAAKQVFPAISVQAKDYLSELVSIFRQGRTVPFIFFPDTSWQIAQAFLKTDRKWTRENFLKGFDPASRKWFDAFRNRGDKTDRYVQLFYNTTDLFESTGIFLSSGLAENSIRVFKPLMEHMRQDS